MNSFIDISSESAEAMPVAGINSAGNAADSNVQITDHPSIIRSSCATPKGFEVENLRSQLAALHAENNRLSNELASVLRREIESSFSAAEQVAGDQGNPMLAQLNDALNQSKTLYEENTSLRSQVAAAQQQLAEKKRLETELLRLKEKWNCLSQLGQMGFNVSSPQQRPSPQPAQLQQMAYASNLTMELQSQENQAFKEENAKLRSEIAQLRNQVCDEVRLNNEVEKLRLENGQLGQQYRQLMNENERLKQEYGSGAQRNAQEYLVLQNEARRLAQIVSDQSALVETNIQLGQEIQQLQLNVAQLKEERASLYQQFKAVTEDLSNLQTEFIQSKQENQRLLTEMNSMASKLSAFETDNGLISGENFILKTKLEETEKKLLAAEGRSEKWNSKLKKLASDSTRLKAALADLRKQYQDGIRGQERSVAWPDDLARILIGHDSKLAMSTTVSESQTEPYPPESYKEAMMKLAVNVDSWAKKYQELVKKVLDAKKWSIEDAKSSIIPHLTIDDNGGIAMKQTAAIALPEAGNTGSKSSATNDSVVMQRLLRNSAIEVERVRGVYLQKLMGGHRVGEVFVAADTVWQSMRGVIEAVAQKNLEMEPDLNLQISGLFVSETEKNGKSKKAMPCVNPPDDKQEEIMQE